MRVRAAVLAGCVLAVAAAAPTEAYVIAGRAWPTTTITYYAGASGYRGAVDRAVRVYNRAGIGVRLRRAAGAGTADVVFVYGGRRCEGSSYVGFQRWRTSTVDLGRGCSPGLITLTAVHELGHVFGLDHEYRVCARMNPTFDESGTPTRCAHHALSYWLRHPLTADDLRGLRAIYSFDET